MVVPTVLAITARRSWIRCSASGNGPERTLVTLMVTPPSTSFVYRNYKTRLRVRNTDKRNFVAGLFWGVRTDRLQSARPLRGWIYGWRVEGGRSRWTARHSGARLRQMAGMTSARGDLADDGAIGSAARHPAAHKAL